MPAAADVTSEKRALVSTSGSGKTFEDMLAAVGMSGLYARASPEAAMGISTFFGCAKLISNTLASLPFGVFQKLDGGGSNRQDDGDLDYILHTRFNPNMSSFIARRTLILNMIVWGWAIAEIRRDGLNRVVSIVPYATKDVTVLYDEETERYYFYVAKKRKKFRQDEVIFLRDLCFDGNLGTSIIDWQSQVLDIDLLAKAFLKRFYKDGTFMGGFFSTPLGYGAKDEEASKEFKKRLVESFEGGNDGGFAFAVLGAGVEWHPIGKTPVEADLLKTFEKSDRDIAKMFNTPLAMIGDNSTTTSFGTGVEQFYIGFTNNVIGPLSVQIEQEFDYKCFSKQQAKDKYYTRHNFKGLLKGDLKAQAEYNRTMVNAGIDTPDEIRATDEKPPHKKGVGAKPYMQGAMIAMDKMNERVPKNKQNGKTDSAPVTE